MKQRLAFAMAVALKADAASLRPCFDAPVDERDSELASPALGFAAT